MVGQENREKKETRNPEKRKKKSVSSRDEIFQNLRKINDGQKRRKKNKRKATIMHIKI